MGSSHTSASRIQSHYVKNAAAAAIATVTFPRGGSSSLFASFAKTEDTEEDVDDNDNDNDNEINGVGTTNKNSNSYQKTPIKINGASKIGFDPKMDADKLQPAMHIAETNLPTDIGHFRLRAYRVEDPSSVTNMHVGSEPCVIYSTARPPFGLKGVPVRIHDQCFTSEVFRSQRWVLVS